MAKILVGLDGSKASSGALLHALELARWLRSPVEGLAVVDSLLLDAYLMGDLGGMIGATPVTSLRSGMEKVLKGRAKTTLDEAAAEARRRGVGFAGRVRTGRVGPTLLAASRGASHVVLGLTGTGGHAAVGRQLSAVLHGARRPVLAAPARFERPRRLTVAFDGSAYSRKALAQARVLARRAGLPLEAVHVSEDGGAGVLEPVRRLAPEARRVHLRGPVRATLCRLAAKPGAWLALGPHGHGTFRELVLGSTVHYVLAAARTAVLLAR